MIPHMMLGLGFTMGDIGGSASPLPSVLLWEPIATLRSSSKFAKVIYSILFFRQKQSIFQLQQQLLLQTNTAMPQAMPTHYHISQSHSSAGDNSSLSLKLQECQYENAQLRAHLSEKDSSLDKLQKKLGWEINECSLFFSYSIKHADIGRLQAIVSFWRWRETKKKERKTKKKQGFVYNTCSWDLQCCMLINLDVVKRQM